MALRAPTIKDLVEGGAIQMALFDERDMAALTSPDDPGERLICAAIPTWRASVTASVKICCRPPNAISPPSSGRLRARPSHCAAQPRSASGSGRC